MARARGGSSHRQQSPVLGPATSRRSCDLLRATSTAELSDIPLLLVRPENDFDWIATASTALLEHGASQRRAVDVIEVPGGHHGFETVDDTDEARDAIERSIAWGVEALG